ncbi:MAG: tol-pal system protein YbgF [Acidobacteriota bacterium]
MRALVALGLIGLAVSGCASQGVQRVLTPNDRLRDEVRELERLVVDLQRKATVSEVEVARLKERVVELEVDRERLEEAIASRPAPSPTRGLIEEPLPSATRPAGRIETSDLEPEPLPAPVVSERQPAVEVAPSNAPTERPAPPPSPEPSRRAAEPTRLTAEPMAVTAAGQAIYDQGYTQYHRGQYIDAEASFLRFLEGFPNSELSDNAQFWIGEARFSRGDYPGALNAFREVVNRFPEGNKVPDALVKSGQALEQQGDIAAARRSYEEVKRRFPESPAALRAEERLDELGA